MGEKYGESSITFIPNTNGKLPYASFADYARSHTQLRRRCAFKKDGHMHSADKGYMKLLRMYMQEIKMYLNEGPVVAASAAGGEAAAAEYSQTAVAVCSDTAVAVCSDDPSIRHIPKRPRLGCRYHSTKRGVIQNWKRRRLIGGGGID